VHGQSQGRHPATLDERSPMPADTRRVSSRTRKSSVAKAVPVPADESRRSIKIVRR
jgi:hypothetical protein